MQAFRRNNNPPPNVSLSIHNTHHSIISSPNSHASPSKNDPSKNNPSKNNLSKSNNHLSENDQSILSIKECINIIKDSNMLPIPFY